MYAGSEVVDGEGECEGAHLIFGTNVEGESHVCVAKDVAHGDIHVMLVGIVRGKGRGLNLVIDTGGDWVEVGVGVEYNLGIVGLHVGNAIEELDTGTNGEVERIKRVGGAKGGLEIGVDVENVAIGKINLWDGSTVLVDVTIYQGPDGRNRKGGIDKIDHTGVEGEEHILHFETKAKDVDVGSQTEGVVLTKVVENGVEIDECALCRLVIVDDIVQGQRAAKLEVDAGKHQVETIVGGEEGSVG